MTKTMILYCFYCKKEIDYRTNNVKKSTCVECRDERVRERALVRGRRIRDDKMKQQCAPQ